jgi:hypothetical protein
MTLAQAPTLPAIGAAYNFTGPLEVEVIREGGLASLSFISASGRKVFTASLEHSGADAIAQVCAEALAAIDWPVTYTQGLKKRGQR